MPASKINRFPETRITTIDVCEMGKKKHHVSGFFEIDVTCGRQKIREFNRNHTDKISFTGWLIYQFAQAVNKHQHIASFLLSKRKQVVFTDVNVSVLVEKEFEGNKIPIPLVIERTQTLSPSEITKIIRDGQNQSLEKNDLVLHRQTRTYEKLYYRLPGIIRRKIWSFVLSRPKLAFKNMGNVSVTSLGMFGKVNGWFVPISIHPICFGVGQVVEKPQAINKQIEIRQILNLTVLVDHDVIDGAQIARFIQALANNLETGEGI